MVGNSEARLVTWPWSASFPGRGARVESPRARRVRVAARERTERRRARREEGGEEESRGSRRGPPPRGRYTTSVWTK